jgi:hypothetical protein
VHRGTNCFMVVNYETRYAFRRRAKSRSRHKGRMSPGEAHSGTDSERFPAAVRPL